MNQATKMAEMRKNEMQQRFFKPTESTITSAADVEQASDTWLDTLARATGWLNPFKLLQGRPRAFIFTFTVLHLLTHAMAKVSFMDPRMTGKDGNRIDFCFDLECFRGEQENYLVKLITDTFTYFKMEDSHQYRCPDINDRSANTDRLGYESPEGWFGKSLFGGTICYLSARVGAYNSSQLEYYEDENAYQVCRQTQLWTQDRYNISSLLNANVKSENQYGTTQDIMATVGLALMGVGALAAATIYSGLRYHHSESGIQRRIRRKYNRMTHALLQNDVELFNEVNQIAHAAGYDLPKDVLTHIVKNLPGYDDVTFKRNYFNSANHDPSPPDFAANDVSGVKAAFIRFYDSSARRQARAGALLRAWREIKSERDNLRLLPELDDEQAPLLAVRVSPGLSSK
jgi:hypothetical protein